MTASPAVFPTGAPPGVALLERSIGYTRTALALVQPDRLAARTPCSQWSLRALLVHMNDSLAAFTEAAEVGEVGAVGSLPVTDASPSALVDLIKVRACDALAAWSRVYGGEVVRIGSATHHPAHIDVSLLAAIGSLEITVHGWDVAQACGVEHPIPPKLARALLGVAPDVVADTDRAHRFGPARLTDSEDPGERLLAFLGR